MLPAHFFNRYMCKEVRYSFFIVYRVYGREVEDGHRQCRIYDSDYIPRMSAKKE